MFKQLMDGMRAKSLQSAIIDSMKLVNEAKIDSATKRLRDARALLLKTKVSKDELLMIALSYAGMSMSLIDLGEQELSDHCLDMSKLANARMAAGDYYAFEV